jgi:hypothetical protein
MTTRSRDKPDELGAHTETIKPDRALVAFFLLAFAVSWLLWLPQVPDHAVRVQLPDIVGLLGMFAPLGPSIAALWRTGQQGGRLNNPAPLLPGSAISHPEGPRRKSGGRQRRDPELGKP